MNDFKKLHKKNIQDIIALTPLQEGMLFHYLKEPHSDLYFEQLNLEITGKIDDRVFEKAWFFVVETNEMLRTVFRWEKMEHPVQVILKDKKPDLRYVNLSDKPPPERLSLLKEIIEKDREEKFVLTDTPFRITLCKLGEERYNIIISNHHILYDGWSNGIILEEFFKAYEDLFSRRQPQKLVKSTFREYVKWKQQQDSKGQQVFWRDYLEGFSTGTELPITKEKEKEIKKGASLTIRLAPEERTRLKELARNLRVTPASFFYCAWGILLQRYNDCEDVVFGITVSGRSARLEGVEAIVGLFINTLPLRVRTNNGERVRDLLHQIEEGMQKSEPYASTPLVDIKSSSEIGINRELFHSLVDVENYPLDMMALGNRFFSMQSYSVSEMTHYDLTVGVSFRDHMEVRFLYPLHLYKKETIAPLAGHFRQILNEITTHPEKGVTELEIIPLEEKQEILFHFNDTHVQYPHDITIYQWFEGSVQKTPDNIAIKYEDSQLTYRELDRTANCWAGVLRNKGIAANDIVCIMMERSLEMVAAIFAILKAGGAYLPVDVSFPQARKNFILRDSSAKLMLTWDALPGIPATGEIYDPTANEHNAADLAYVIYTSGSTGRPKGVMIEHRSVVNLLFYLDESYPVAGQDVYLFNTSYSFDVSVPELFGWFPRSGGLEVLKKGGEMDPAIILEAIKQKSITHINFVPSMFNVFVDMLNEKEIGDLSPLKYIFLAGEKLSAQLVDKFRRLNIDVRLENLYGPTEATVYASGYSLSRWDGCDDIPIGKPLPNIRLFIVDKNNRLRPVGVPGELLITGTGTARGYLNQQELTAEKFIKRFADVSPTGAGFSKEPLVADGIRMYRTNDLVRWLPDGNIQFLGRIDQQVKIRGFRIELGEIENALMKCDKVREAIVIARDDKGDKKYLCAYVVFDSSGLPGSVDISQLRAELEKKLPSYMIPAYYVHLENLPLTPSGKVDRKALPDPEITLENIRTAPRNPLEETLVEMWSKLLKIDEEAIGIHDNFFQLGGHSLNAVMLISRLHREFEAGISINQFFDTPTIHGLAQFLQKAMKTTYTAPEPAEKKEYYPLSSAQKRLYILHQMDPASTAYNMPYALSMEGVVDSDRLTEAFHRLIDRHENLRTSFQMVDNEPVQRIQKTVEFTVTYAPLDEKPFLPGFVRPFDLSHAPLFRLGMKKIEESKHILMIDMHHIISDAISTEIFIKEFASLYRGDGLPELRLQYRDHSEWQNCDAGKAVLEEQEVYWLEQFSGEIQPLDLPTDYSRPAIQHFEGDSVTFTLNAIKTEKLKQYAVEKSVTLYMLFLALYTVLLSKLTQREDIVVGTPVAGRSYAELEPLIGIFINTLCLRNFPSGEKAFDTFLDELKYNTLGAFENQNYPFEELVDKLTIPRDLSRNPLFDTMFSFQDIPAPKMELPGLKLTPIELENRTSQFDLTLQTVEIENELRFTFQYSTQLFKRTTIQRFAVYFKTLTTNTIVSPDAKISEIDILTAEEKHRLLKEFNDTAVAYPKDKTLDELFSSQVAKAPDNIALVGVDGLSHFTYREIGRRSDNLAHHLRHRGVEPETIVAIMVERSLEMIVGILGILKAGGAYLPIDPDYPRERSDYLLADSNTSLLLTTQKLSSHVEGLRMVGKAEIFFIAHPQLSQPPGKLCRPPNPSLVHHPRTLAYVIYTSGSTGKPKGVMIEHISVINLILFQIKRFKMIADDRVLQFTSFSFDASVEQFFLSLLSGAALVLVDNDTIRDNSRFESFILERGITHIHATPSLLTHIKLEWASGLKRVIAGGDVCPLSLAKRWSRICDFYNEYGPTETTITSVELKLNDIPIEAMIKETGANTSSPLGRPIANTKVYLLDKSMKPVPVGIMGEMYVGGDGLARGYLNHPGLTNEKFVNGTNIVGTTDEPPLLYQTGDLARWREDSHLEFLGRIDYQVKIRGFRIELEEIESRLSKHEAISIALVQVKEDEGGDKYICAYIVTTLSAAIAQTPPSEEKLKNYLSRTLPDYMIPSHFVFLEELPLTPNGKIDRRALPDPEFRSSADYVAPSNNIEIKLVEIWSEVMGIEADKLSTQDNFFHIGGDSIKSILIFSRIHKVFDMEISVNAIFEKPTVKGLAEFMRNSFENKFVPIPVVEKKEYYPLSPAQTRIFIIHQLAPGTTAYNLPLAESLNGDLDVEKLEAVFGQLIRRHESLRTSIGIIESRPVQWIHPQVNFSVQYHDGEKEAVIQNFIRPFDLSQPPMLRVGIIKTNQEEHLLIIDMHHIISDGVSAQILLKEFTDLYSGEELHPLKLQYKDYSEWLNSPARIKAVKRQENYWVEQFEGPTPVLDLPTDYARPREQSFEGSAVSFVMDKEETLRIHELAHAMDTTPFMVLLAVYTVFLSKLSGQDDIIIGTLTAGRHHADLQSIIGMFINTLVIRNRPEGKKTFKEFLAEVREKTLEVFENQDYPFEKLVDQIAVHADRSRNLLFDTMFTLHNFERATMQGGELSLTPYPYETRTVKFDLVFTAVEGLDQLHMIVEYSTNLFKRETIEAFTGYFREIATQVVENNDIKLADILLSHGLVGLSSVMANEEGDFCL